MIVKKDVTIIIPHFGATKDQCRAFGETVRSLHAHSPEIKILVVKNGPHACQCRRNIRILKQGQCIAVNAAVATINTEWVFISNDDMIYPPRWWEHLTDKIEGASICISPKLVEPRSGAPTFETFFAGGAGGDFDGGLWLEYAKQYEHANEGEWRTGFNFPVLIKRDLWNLIDGYDINYDPWGSNGDSDLEYKIMLAGVQPMQNGRCIVYHFSQTSGTFEPKNDSYRFKNYGYFKEKWGFDRTDDGIWEASFRIPTKAMGRLYSPRWEGKYK